MPLVGVEMGDDLWTMRSQRRHKLHTNIMDQELLQSIRNQGSVLLSELTYGDIAQWWIEVWQSDGWLVEVGGLVCERYRIVWVGSIARDITSRNHSMISARFNKFDGEDGIISA